MSLDKFTNKKKGEEKMQEKIHRSSLSRSPFRVQEKGARKNTGIGKMTKPKVDGRNAVTTVPLTTVRVYFSTPLC